MTTTWLWVALGVEAVLCAFVLVLLVVEAAVSWARDRNAPAVAVARDAVVRAVHGEGDAAPAVGALLPLPERRTIPLLIQLADAVSGSSLDRLRALAEQAGLTERAHSWCRSRSWWRRLWGIRLLTRLDAGRGDVVVALLDDPVGAVAAAAADSVGPHSAPRAFERLLRMLDDHRPECRFAAKAALHASGAAAVPALRRYLEDVTSPRLADALEAATGGSTLQLLPVAEQRSADSDPAVRTRAAGLLAAIGGGQAALRLSALLADPDAGVRAASALGLGRLGEWSRATGVARLLHDPQWTVRRAAALALHGMGPPGRLYLRRTVAADTGPAADAARYVLDLPEGATETVSP